MEKTFKDTISSANFEDIFTIVYYFVDESYKNFAYMLKRSGPAPIFSDSEVLTLCIVNQMVNDSETAYYNYIRKNYLHLFPKMINRTRYHRRAKDLYRIANLIRLELLWKMDVNMQSHHVMDSMPVPVCKYARASRNLTFAAEYGVDNDSLYGYCAAKKEDYYGFKLHLLVTTQGIPAHFVLAPASHHDVTLAPEMLQSYRNLITVLGDKGYVGIEKKLADKTDYQLIIQKRANQIPNTKNEKSWLALFRKTIETTNSQLAGQFHLQYTRAKSAWGLNSRVVYKIAAYTMSVFLNFCADLPLLNIKSLIF